MLHCATHDEYLTHLRGQFIRYQDDADFHRAFALVAYEFVSLLTLSLDGVRESMMTLYCPTGQGDPYDPCAMLRS